MPDAPVTLPVQLELDPSAPARLVNQINAVSSQVKPVRIPYDGAPLGRITGDLRDLDRSLAASNARVIAFGATTGVLFGVAEAFRGLVRTTIDVEKELTNIQSILHVSNQGFGQLKSSLFDIAGATATSFKQVAEVAANFARQGLGLNETLKRTRDALILARETGIDAKAAFTDLTAAVNTFQREALDSTTIINKLVAVSTSFAVTSGDLAEGIKRAGATAQAAKVDFDQLVGAITAIQQATGRGGGVAGTALQRIFARIESAPTLKALEDVKVKTRDLNGAVLPAIEILQDLAQKFKGLDDVQRSQVSQALAGRVQFNQLNALLRDYARENSVAAQATQRSANATDEAIKRNNELNTSLSALINKTKESGAALASAFGDKTVGPALRSLLNLLNKGLDFGRSAQGSDSLGAKIGSGIVDGIGTALKGPGFVILSAVILALFKKVGGAAIQAVGELSGITGHVKEQETLQASINRLMVTGNKEIVQRLQTTTDVTKQQEFLNQLIAEENAKLIIQRGLQADLAALASRTYRGGAPVVGQQGVQLVPKASGYIPNASEGMLESLVREKQAVQRGTGGASPAAQPVVIRDFNFGGGQRGPVVANNNEYIVKNFGGGTGSAIFNPQMIARMGGLGQLFGMGSVERVASGGFIPNYAKANLNIWEQMEKDLEKRTGIDLSKIKTQDRTLASPTKVYGWLDPHGKYEPNGDYDIHQQTIARLLDEGLNEGSMERAYRAGFENKYLRLRTSDGDKRKLFVHFPSEYGDISHSQKQKLIELAQQNHMTKIVHDFGYPNGHKELWRDPIFGEDTPKAFSKGFVPNFPQGYTKFLHGTSLKNLESILHQGIVPGNKFNRTFSGLAEYYQGRENAVFASRDVRNMSADAFPGYGRKGFLMHRDAARLRSKVDESKQAFVLLNIPHDFVKSFGARDEFSPGSTVFNKPIPPEFIKDFFIKEAAGGFVPNRLIRESDILQRHPYPGFNIGDSLSGLTLDNLKALRAKEARFLKQARNEQEAEEAIQHYQLFDQELKGRLKYINAPIGAGGFVPNFANISMEEAARLLRSKKFQSITYQKKTGELANYNAAQHHVRRDLLVGADAPEGYKNWTDFDQQTNSLVLRNIKEGEEAAKFRRFNLSGIKQIRAEGQTFDVFNQGFVPNYAEFKIAFRMANGKVRVGRKDERMHAQLAERLNKQYGMWGDEEKGYYAPELKKFLTQDEASAIVGYRADSFGTGGIELAKGFVPNAADYPLFDMDFLRKKSAFGGDLDWKNVLRYIDPKEFEKFAAPLVPNSPESRQNIDYLKGRMEAGHSFSPAWLRLGLQGESPIIKGHEGRHRAVAASELGISSLPTLLDIQDFGRAPDLKFGGRLDKILGASYLNEANLFKTYPTNFTKLPHNFNFLQGALKGRFSGGYIPNFAEGVPSPDYIQTLLRSYTRLTPEQRAARDRYAFDIAQKVGVYKQGMSGYEALQAALPKARQQEFFGQLGGYTFPQTLTGLQPTPTAPLALPPPSIFSPGQQGFTLVGQSYAGVPPTEPAATTPSTGFQTPLPQAVRSPSLYQGRPITEEQERRIAALITGRGKGLHSKGFTEEVEKILNETALPFEGGSPGSPLATTGNLLFQQEQKRNRLIEEERLKVGKFFQAESERGFIKRFGFGSRVENLESGLTTQEARDLIPGQRALRQRELRPGRQQAALTAALVAPSILQGAGEGFFGVNPESQGGRTFAGVTGALATGTSIGALAPGPVGLIAGGLYTAFGSLKAITDNLTKSFSEISKSIDESNHKREEEAHSINAAVQSISEFADISQGGNKGAIARSQTQIQGLVGTVPEKFRNDFIAAAAAPTEKNINRLLDIQNQVNTENQRNSQAGEAAKALLIQSDKSSSSSRFFGDLAGTQRNVLSAFQTRPDAQFGERFSNLIGRARYAFFNNTLGEDLHGQALRQVFAPNEDTLKQVKAGFQPPEVKDALNTINAIKAVNVDTEAITKQFDVNQLIKDLGVKDPGEILKKVFQAGGVDKDTIDQVVKALETQGGETTKQQDVAAELRHILKLEDARKKIRDSNDKYGQSLSDFLKFNDDILKDVAHNFQIDSIRQQGTRALGLQRSAGLLEIARPGLTPQAEEGFRATQQLNAVRGEEIDKLREVLDKTLGKFNIEPEALQGPGVAKAVASAAAELSRNPQNAPAELTKIGQAIKDSGLSNADKLFDKFDQAGRELAREIQVVNEQFVFKYKEANQEHQLNLTKIQAEQLRGFLGGDFRKLPGFDFSQFAPGIAGLKNLFGVGGVVGSGFTRGISQTGLANLTGQETPFYPFVPSSQRDPRINRPSGSALVDFFHPIEDFRAERAFTAQRAEAVTQTGGLLQSLGLLDNEPGLQQKYASIGAKGAKAAMDNFLNDLEKQFADAGQFEEVLAIRRNRPRAQEAAVLQEGEKFRQTPYAVALKNQQAYDTQLSTTALAGLDPIKQNTLSLIQSKTSIQDLTKSVEKLTAAQEASNALTKQKETTDPNAPPPLLARPDDQKARGYIPNFNAMWKEWRDIHNGVGGAQAGDYPYQTNVRGLGNVVVNSGETIARNWMGSGKDAVLNRRMKRHLGWGWTPNYADDQPYHNPLADEEDNNLSFQERLKEYQKVHPEGQPSPALIFPSTLGSLDPRSASSLNAFKQVENSVTRKIFGGMTAEEFIGGFATRGANQFAQERGYASAEEERKIASQAGTSDDLVQSAIEAGHIIVNSNTDFTPELSSAIEGGRINQPVAQAQPLTRAQLDAEEAAAAATAFRQRHVNPFLTNQRLTSEQYNAQERAQFLGGGRRITSDEYNRTQGVSGRRLTSEEYNARERGGRRITSEEWNRSQSPFAVSPSIRTESESGLPTLQGLKEFSKKYHQVIDTHSQGYQELFRNQKVNELKTKVQTLQQQLRPNRPGGWSPHLPILDRLNPLHEPLSGFRHIEPDKFVPFDVTAALGWIPSFDDDELTVGSLLNKKKMAELLGEDPEPTPSPSPTPPPKKGWLGKWFGGKARGWIPTFAFELDTNYGDLGSGASLGENYSTTGRRNSKGYNRTNIFRGGYRGLYDYQTALQTYEQWAKSQGPTPFRLGHGGGGFASGYMPNFNDAIQRETNALKKRGISNPADYIFVGHAQGITGVGNTIDEPQGLQQGINRYLRAGKNPRMAGVPNYAVDKNDEKFASILSRIEAFAAQLVQIFHPKEKPQTKDGGGQTGKNQVDHNVKADVSVTLSGSGGIPAGIQSQVQEAIKTFKEDIEKRVNALEKNSGVLTPPPAAQSVGQLLTSSFH